MSPPPPPDAEPPPPPVPQEQTPAMHMPAHVLAVHAMPSVTGTAMQPMTGSRLSVVHSF
jgi:hypothetical protein